MFYYTGELVRLRLISRFPKEALHKIAPDAEWAAQLLLVSRWFTEAPCPLNIQDDQWMRCCDIDSDPADPNIFVEVVVGGTGPLTLKSPNSKDILAGRLILSNKEEIDYNIESQAPVLLYQCEDIFTKQVKGRNYLRRHKHIEKGGRLLWNLKAKQFLTVLTEDTPNNQEATCEAPQVEDEQFVVTL